MCDSRGSNARAHAAAADLEQNLRVGLGPDAFERVRRRLDHLDRPVEQRRQCGCRRHVPKNRQDEAEGGLLARLPVRERAHELADRPGAARFRDRFFDPLAAPEVLGVPLAQFIERQGGHPHDGPGAAAHERHQRSHGGAISGAAQGPRRLGRVLRLVEESGQRRHRARVTAASEDVDGGEDTEEISASDRFDQGVDRRPSPDSTEGLDRRDGDVVVLMVDERRECRKRLPRSPATQDLRHVGDDRRIWIGGHRGQRGVDLRVQGGEGIDGRGDAGFVATAVVQGPAERGDHRAAPGCQPGHHRPSHRPARVIEQIDERRDANRAIGDQSLDALQALTLFGREPESIRRGHAGSVDLGAAVSSPRVRSDASAAVTVSFASACFSLAIRILPMPAATAVTSPLMRTAVLVCWATVVTMVRVLAADVGDGLVDLLAGGGLLRRHPGNRRHAAPLLGCRIGQRRQHVRLLCDCARGLFGELPDVVAGGRKPGHGLGLLGGRLGDLRRQLGDLPRRDLHLTEGARLLADPLRVLEGALLERSRRRWPPPQRHAPVRSAPRTMRWEEAVTSLASLLSAERVRVCSVMAVVVCWASVRMRSAALASCPAARRLLVGRARDLLHVDRRAAWSSFTAARNARACSPVASLVCLAIRRISEAAWLML